MRILYLQYADPGAYPPVQHSSRIFADARWEVTMVGVRRAGPRFPPCAGVTLRLLADSRAGWRQKLHYLRFGITALVEVLRRKPDWVYVSDPQAAPAALLLRLVRRLRFVYHEHDVPEESAGGSSPWARFTRWARRRLARAAQLCVLPNDSRAEAFGRALGCEDRVVCVWNCPHSTEAKLSPWSQDGLRIAYHGSIVPGRPPMEILDAMATLPPDVTLQLVGYATLGRPAYLAELLEYAQKVGIGDRVSSLGTLPRDAMLDALSGCHLGLALVPQVHENVNMKWLVGASNKPFDYLARGVPVMITDLAEWEETYSKPGFGISCNPDDLADLAGKLRWCVEHRDALEQMGKRGHERIAARWNYEKQFEPVFRFMSGG